MLVSMLVGTLGLGIFVYGKKQTRLPHMLTGVLMMAYPYFVSNPLLSIGIGVALVAALTVAVKAGA
jgi:hypothetical protein